MTQLRRKTSIIQNTTLNDYNFEEWDSFVYLGITLTKDSERDGSTQKSSDKHFERPRSSTIEQGGENKQKFS